MSLKPVELLYRKTGGSFDIHSHFHNRYEIIYMNSGAVSIKVSGSMYRIDSKALIFINKFETHELTAHSYPYSRYFLLITPDFLYRSIKNPVLLSVLKHRPRNFSHAVMLGPEAARVTGSLFSQMLEETEQKKQMWEISIGCMLKQLLLNVYRSSPDSFPASSLNESMKVVIDVQNYIDRHYTEDIRLTEIAARHHMDMFYLSRLFSRYTGYTFRQYITLQRISRAQELLYGTSKNITRIGTDSGFNSVNHFIRIFKKYEGITPLQYRKKAKELYFTS